MLSYDKNNTPEEIEALKTLREGLLPEIEEADFLRVWLPAFVNAEPKVYINAWIDKVSKNPNQSVKIMRGDRHVATVPPILGEWPTEAPLGPRETISELMAGAQATAAQIPQNGVTYLQRGLSAHFERIAKTPIVAKLKDKHSKAWVDLFALYGVKTPNAPDTPGVAKQKQEDTTGLFDDFEEF